MDFTGLQIHFLLRILQEQPHVSFQNVKSIGDIGVGVPGHLLRRRELQLHDAKAGARCMLNATLDLVEMTGVPDCLPLFHIGLRRISLPSAHFPKFVLHRGAYFHELRKVMGTSKHIDSSAAFLFEVPGSNSALVVQQLQIGGTRLV